MWPEVCTPNRSPLTVVRNQYNYESFTFYKHFFETMTQY